MSLRLWWGIVIASAMMAGMQQVRDTLAYLNSLGDIERSVIVALILGIPTFFGWLLNRFLKKHRPSILWTPIRQWGLNHRKMFVFLSAVAGALAFGSFAYLVTRVGSEKSEQPEQSALMPAAPRAEPPAERQSDELDARTRVTVIR